MQNANFEWLARGVVEDLSRFTAVPVSNSGYPKVSSTFAMSREYDFWKKRYYILICSVTQQGDDYSIRVF